MKKTNRKPPVNITPYCGLCSRPVLDTNSVTVDGKLFHVACAQSPYASPSCDELEKRINKLEQTVNHLRVQEGRLIAMAAAAGCSRETVVIPAES